MTCTVGGCQVLHVAALGAKGVEEEDKSVLGMRKEGGVIYRSWRRDTSKAPRAVGRTEYPIELGEIFGPCLTYFPKLEVLLKQVRALTWLSTVPKEQYLGGCVI